MKTVIALGLALAVLGFGGPVAAHVAEVTTSVSLADMGDADELPTLIRTAVDSAIHDTINFSPTLIAVTEARVVGERLWMRLLFADEDGERALDELNAGRSAPPARQQAPAANSSSI